jgi:hypothetical protein
MKKPPGRAQGHHSEASRPCFARAGPHKRGSEMKFITRPGSVAQSAQRGNPYATIAERAQRDSPGLVRELSALMTRKTGGGAATIMRRADIARRMLDKLETIA